MASVKESKSHDMGMHAEQLAGRTQQMYFSASAEENFVHAYAYDVDFEKSTEFDCADMETKDININGIRCTPAGLADSRSAADEVYTKVLKKSIVITTNLQILSGRASGL